MLFNTINFFVFLPVVLLVHWLLPRRFKAFFLLSSSYFFYGAWDPRFLSLLIISTLIDYLCSLGISRTENQKVKFRYLLAAMSGNLGMLFYFKYANFFVDSFRMLFANAPLQPDERFLQVVLPVGISFYTFQTMSYTIDVYRGKLKAEKNIIDFALYVAFFPQLVAGPIERAGNLLKQLKHPAKVTPTLIREALWLMIYGLFKKVVVADNIAILVNPIMLHPEQHHGFINLLAVYATAIFHYADFSGYSDMACGMARLFGVKLMFNFQLPFFESNPRSFWRHWHVSLMLWFRDYVYIPLRKSNIFKRIPEYLHDPVALIITFTLIGIWHGADVHFALWGLVNGALAVGYNILQPTLSRFFKRPSALTTIAFHLWFFPAMGYLIVCPSTYAAYQCIVRIFQPFEFNPGILGWTVIMFATPMFLIDFYLHKKNDLLAFTKIGDFKLLWVTLALWFIILLSGFMDKNDFLYFQF